MGHRVRTVERRCLEMMLTETSERTKWQSPHRPSHSLRGNSNHSSHQKDPSKASLRWRRGRLMWHPCKNVFWVQRLPLCDIRSQAKSRHSHTVDLSPLQSSGKGVDKIEATTVWSLKLEKSRHSAQSNRGWSKEGALEQYITEFLVFLSSPAYLFVALDEFLPA